MPFVYKRSTTASRRAERQVKYLHESAPVITVPHPLDKHLDGTPVLMPVLRTRQYFPKDLRGVFRGDTYNVGRNRTKHTKSERRAIKQARIAARAAA